MSIDPNFPIPESTFLFCHTLTHKQHNPATVGVDTDTGRWSHAAPAVTVFTGYLCGPRPREIDRAAARGIQLDAVVLAPLALDITDAQAATLEAEAQSGLSSWLVGRYSISEIHPTVAHLRLLLTRIKGDEYPPRDTEPVEALVSPPTIGGGVDI